ncbi:MAG: transcriptional regulator [Thermoplasmata archaeon]|jgi:putative transcriptional regulator|nr:transcriptional regulator [Thermoplasmata archaeon]MVT13612.1 transcriptional regulator [Euryarchaeota archaeon]MVT15063.1 transcriptional regulator [Euryarchaeota archaeon]MVT36234.1 transcriptional regulator [Euryarchaeota archaeon]
MEFTRESLIELVRALLRRRGFNLSSENFTSVAYDIIASDNENIFIIKVLYNVDTLKQEVANELKLLSKIIKAKPLIIGVRCGIGILEDYILYSRYDVPVMSFKTFSNYIIRDELPIGFAAPGGFYVKIESKKLREARERNGISIGDLAKAANVSRRAIQLYEEGKSAVSIDVLIKIENYLNVNLIERIDPFGELPEPDEKFTLPENKIGRDTQEIFNRAGYRIYFTKKTNFDAVSNIMEDVLFIGFTRMREEALFKAKVIEEIAELTEKYGILLTDREGIEKTFPVINIKDLMNTDSETMKTIILEKKFRNF